MGEAIRVARASVEGQQIVAQGGGGGVETRWRGASRVLRSVASWIPGLGSPRRDFNQSERRMLVARSRDAMRNHLVARAAITRLRTNVVGTGLVCRAQVDHEALGITEERAEQLNGQLDRLWSLYADDPRECDAEATLNHYQLQALVLVSSMVAGDVFVASPDQERAGCLFSTRLQLIESDRVGNPNSGMDRPDLVEGIEFDGLGRQWPTTFAPVIPVSICQVIPCAGSVCKCSVRRQAGGECFTSCRTKSGPARSAAHRTYRLCWSRCRSWSATAAPS